MEEVVIMTCMYPWSRAWKNILRNRRFLTAVYNPSFNRVVVKKASSPDTEIPEITVPLTDSFLYTIPLPIACGIHPPCFGGGYSKHGMWTLLCISRHVPRTYTVQLHNSAYLLLLLVYEIKVDLQMTSTQLPSTRHTNIPDTILCSQTMTVKPNSNHV